MMDSFYLICFCLGLVLSLLSFIGGFAHLHIGRIHIGHFAHGRTPQGAGQRGQGLDAVNGFTIMAFLCWFGGTGYLLHHFNIFVAPLVLLLAVFGGLAGAALIWAALFKVLLPREHILTSEETEMTGVLARVSDAIRDTNGVGEIIFSQAGARRAAAARSEDGLAIERGTEVVVLRYEHGIAHVRRFDDLSPSAESPPNGLP
jgi:membrane protein implicated in regulation of membrane protease activity